MRAEPVEACREVCRGPCPEPECALSLSKRAGRYAGDRALSLSIMCPEPVEGHPSARFDKLSAHNRMCPEPVEGHSNSLLRPLR
jgi:hypothetical protein